MNEYSLLLNIANNEGINFFDVELLIENEKIIFDNYKKLTNSDRYLNFYSNHHQLKRGIIIGQEV